MKWVQQMNNINKTVEQMIFIIINIDKITK